MFDSGIDIMQKAISFQEQYVHVPCNLHTHVISQLVVHYFYYWQVYHVTRVKVYGHNIRFFFFFFFFLFLWTFSNYVRTFSDSVLPLSFSYISVQ